MRYRDWGTRQPVRPCVRLRASAALTRLRRASPKLQLMAVHTVYLPDRCQARLMQQAQLTWLALIAAAAGAGPVDEQACC